MGLVLQGVYSIPELRSQIKQSYVYESRDNCSYLKYTYFPRPSLLFLLSTLFQYHVSHIRWPYKTTLYWTYCQHIQHPDNPLYKQINIHHIMCLFSVI